MRRVLFFLIVLMILTACSNFHMEKRRYNKGFHISFVKKQRKTTTKNNVQSINSRSRGKVVNHSDETKGVVEITASAIDSSSLNVSVQNKNDLARPVSTVNESNHTTVVNETVKTPVDHANLEQLISAKKFATTRKNERSSGLWYFALLATLPMLFAAKRHLHQLGTWAAENRSKARMTIATLYGVGFSSSFLIGNMWQPIIEEWMMVIPLTLAGSVLVADVVNTKGIGSFMGKRIARSAVTSSSFFATFTMGAQAKLQFIEIADTEPHNGLEPLAAVIVTILLLIAMYAAFSGIAALACNIACSGYGVLALIVAAVGGFAVMFLGVWGILGVVRGRARNSDNIRAALIAGLIMAVLVLLPSAIGALL